MLYLESNLEETYKSKLNTAIQYFSVGKYGGVVSRSLIKYNAGEVGEANKILDELPDKEQLLKDLLVKLKGKSVVRTWGKVLKGKVENKNTQLKALFSLGSHLCVELEMGNIEYSLLLEDIYLRIGSFMGSL